MSIIGNAILVGGGGGSTLPDGDNMGYGGAPPIVGQAIVGTTKL